MCNSLYRTSDRTAERSALGLLSSFANRLDTLRLGLDSLLRKQGKLVKRSVDFLSPLFELGEEVLCDGDDVGTVLVEVITHEVSLADCFEQVIPLLMTA